MMRSWRERFVEVDRGYETPCLEWMGNRINGGYGRVSVSTVSAIRLGKRWAYVS